MSDTEKVSFNMSVVDLGKVDLLVEQSFYSSRTDFMVTAARNLIASHAVSISEAVRKDGMVVGVHTIGRKALEDLRARRKQIDINVIGLFVLSQDVEPQLALATIRSVKIRGAFRTSPELKEALKERMQ